MRDEIRLQIKQSGFNPYASRFLCCVLGKMFACQTPEESLHLCSHYYNYLTVNLLTYGFKKDMLSGQVKQSF